MAEAAPELIRAVLALPPTAYAVVDGAHFDDALLSLAAAEVPARSLFINRSPAAVRSGPFLADLRTPAAREAFFRILGGKPAAVFWTCSQGESILFRHLRTINMVSIPGAGETEDPVLFRHYDPMVLTLVLPLLDSQQFARVMGPAEDIVMFAPDAVGLRHIRRPPDLAAPPTGMLRVSARQITQLENGMSERSRAKIARYLRDVAPEAVSAMTDEGLIQFVRESEEVGRVLGLRTEQGFGRWAFLMLVTKGEAARSREVRVYIADGDDAPDNQVKTLLRFSAMALRNAAAETTL